MATETQKNNRKKVFLGSLLFLGLAGIVVWLGFHGMENPGELEKELKTKERELKRYQIDSGKQIPPTPEAYALLEKVHQKLQMDLGVLEKLIGTIHLEMSEGAVADGLFFREQLFKTDKELHQLAYENETSIPENLGFPEELPDPARVPLLLRQLLTIEQGARVLMELGARSLTVIKPLEIVEHKDTPSNRILFRELPVQIGVECPAQTLVSSLIRLRNSQQMLVIRELQIKSNQDQTLQVNLIISSFFLEEKHAET